ncbi:peptide chain release factor N(5)-glutamine methyltransferase [Planctomicrobium sp.]|jgi:release factor glutamine methyltransferase|nr:peptide chain release factor N(5)-glutamine methyltransferase [Planctomicrobium sp.]MDB4743894.1 peptide chain release factor N(5)-glutamine methyltransferase [Planctomicrobium sp.]
MEEENVAAEQVTSDEAWTVKKVLDWTISYLKEHKSETPRLDAEVLLAFARKCQRIQLYTQFDQLLSEEERGLMRSLVKRRAASEPVAYLVGHREFFSLDFLIEPNVFIPRPDTETLVATALDLLKPLKSPSLLELCTGTGCVPIAIAKNHASVQITTLEKNSAPYAVAARNIKKHEVEDRVKLLNGDLFEPLENGSKFDIIVSNPPYIPKTEIETLESDVRDHEPHVALDGGADGFDVIRILIEQSPLYLNAGGWLLFELSPEQADEGCKLLKEAGFHSVRTEADLSGQARVVLGCWGSS